MRGRWPDKEIGDAEESGLTRVPMIGVLISQQRCKPSPVGRSDPTFGGGSEAGSPREALPGKSAEDLKRARRKSSQCKVPDLTSISDI